MELESLVNTYFHGSLCLHHGQYEKINVIKRDKLNFDLNKLVAVATYPRAKLLFIGLKSISYSDGEKQP